jgi:ABC-type nitrate/sulfonate/bicarbonate transport system substrate-binding protein
MRIRSLSIPVLAAVSLLLAACGGAAAPASSPPAASAPASTAASAKPAAPASAAASAATSAAASAKPAASEAASAPPSFAPGSVRLISGGSIDFSNGDITYWSQLLTQRGMKNDLKWIDDPSAALRAVVANAGDAYIGSLPSAIKAVQNTNADLKVVAINNQASDYVLVTKPEITSLDQLKGKTIGIASPGSAGEVILKIALKLKGIDSSQINFVSIGGTNARVAALLAGKIDGAPAHVAEAAVAEDTGKVKTLFTTGDVMGLYLQSGLIASGAWLKANPQVAQQVVDAFIDASRWAGSNKAEYIDLSKKLEPKMTDQERAESYDLYQKIKLFPTDGGLSADSVSHFIELAQQTGDLSASPPPQSAWLDTSFVKKYLDTHKS